MLFQKRQSVQRDLFLTRFLENLLQSENLVRGVGPGRKPHWPSSRFNSTISRHFLSRYLAYTFPDKLSNDIPL